MYVSQLYIKMILKQLKRVHIHYNKQQIQNFGSGSGFISFFRQMLNRLANEQNRNLRQQRQEQISARQTALQEVSEKPAKNQIEAEKKFQNFQQGVSKLQAGRLERIDDILGTKTYFHETKLYQQRLDSDHVMNISRLHQKMKQAPRQELNYTNPQVKPEGRLKKSRKKYAKMLQKIKKYPSSYPDISSLIQSKTEKENNSELMKMLGEEAIFTNLSLATLNLTIQSIQKQKIYLQKEDGIVEAELDYQPPTCYGYTYFQPVYSNSLFRIASSAYTHKLSESVDQLVIQSQKEESLQELLSVDSVYECLKEFYYDQRVSQYIKKIENNQMDYFISGLQSSPDGRHLVIVIDLLGSKKQYIGIYKYVGNKQIEAKKFHMNNVIFNIRPQFHIENDGSAYYIQRSEEGMFVELVRRKFNEHSNETKPIQKESNTKPENIQKNQDSQIIYRCAPYSSLKILSRKNLQTSNQTSISSFQNILFEESDAVSPMSNNKIFMFNHQQISETNEAPFNLFQEITANSDLKSRESILRNLPEYLKSKYLGNKVKFFHECFEVYGLGYVLVRYLLCDENDQEGFQNQLKYSFNSKIAHFVSIVPYEGVDLDLTSKVNENEYLTRKSLIKQETNLSQEQTQKVQETSLTQKLTDNLKQSSLQFVIKAQQFTTKNKLSIKNEALIYICKQQEYFTSAVLQNLSQTNIYLIMTMSLESVYNNNYLHVHPLRTGIKPYSLYLDGYPIKIQSNYRQKLMNLKVETPIISSKFTYGLWNKELKQILNQRIYSQNVQIQFNNQKLQIKVLSLDRYLNPEISSDSLKDRFVVLYLSSTKQQKLNDLAVRKMLQKGVIFVQLTKGPGLFGSDVVQLMQGTKKFYLNYIESIIKVVDFIKNNISENVGLYSKGGPACYSTLLINAFDNQDGQFVDASVLHEGIYDLTKFPNSETKQYQYFFGTDKTCWEDKNPLDFMIYNPKKQYFPENLPGDSFSDLIIRNLHNIVLSSLNPDAREQSRKFIHKLRNSPNIYFQTVFLKQFDSPYNCDLFNLGFLYLKMKQKAEASYYERLHQKNELKNEDNINDRDLTR